MVFSRRFCMAPSSARILSLETMARLMASTVVGQVADTFIFCAIAATAIGIGDLKTFVNYFVVGVLLKVSVEAVFLPVTVRVIRFIKKNEPEYWI